MGSASLSRWQGVASAFLLLASSVAHAADESARVFRVGFVASQSPSTAPIGVTAFRDRLRELGYVQGKNLVIEARWSGDRYDRLPALVEEVIARKVDILLVAATPAAIAALNATNSIPIVGFGLADPLRTGLATNLARPDKNVTGLSMGWTEGIAGKWLELLQDALPRLSAIAVLANRDNPLVGDLVAELKAVAPTRGVKIRVIDVREPASIDRALVEARRKAQAILVLPIALVPHDAHAQQAAASRRIGVLLVGSLPEGKEAQGFRQPAR